MTQKKAKRPSRTFFARLSLLNSLQGQNNLIAAATENKDYGENYNPSAVIVKEMAEAVVVHICSSKVSFERLLISILCRYVFLVIERIDFLNILILKD